MTEQKHPQWQSTPEEWQKLKPLARQMRKEFSPIERRLWKQIHDKQLGVKFRQQHTIKGYIADFYCREIKLIIELDGRSHDESAAYDGKRQKELEALGYLVIRFSNQEILHNLQGVLEGIAEVVQVRIAQKQKK